MNDVLWGPILSAIVVGLGAVLTYFTARGANRVNEKKLATEEKSSVFEQADELNRYIDERVAKAVAVAVAPLKKRIDEQDRRIAEQDARDRHRTLTARRAFRSVFSQWPHEHPWPRLHRQDVVDIEDIIPPEWLPGPEE